MVRLMAPTIPSESSDSTGRSPCWPERLIIQNLGQGWGGERLPLRVANAVVVEVCCSQKNGGSSAWDEECFVRVPGCYGS